MSFARKTFAIILTKNLHGEWPVFHGTRAKRGRRAAVANPYGAISVIADDGQELGVSPGEFNWAGPNPVNEEEARVREIWGDRDPSRPVPPN